MDELQPGEDGQPDPLHIEPPISLLPDLSLLGIEEFDKGVCRDTFENRAVLRANKMRWQPVFTSHGEPTEFIQCIGEDMLLALQMSNNRDVILLDPRNPNSDYLTGLPLIIETESDNTAPAWVIAATKHWNNVEARRDAGEPNFRPALGGPPGRCIARRVDGNRCRNWHNGEKASEEMCRVHQSNLINKEVNPLERARARIRAAAVKATETMEDLMITATSEPVRLAAAKELLDRGGIRGGVEIDMQAAIVVRPAADEIRDRLDQLAARQAERAEHERRLALTEAGEEEEHLEHEQEALYIESENGEFQEVHQADFEEAVPEEEGKDQ
jgi:hypothetical protein